jgi:N-acetylmuramoyl-L-alanine amidase
MLVRAFTLRLFLETLERTPTREGLDYWINELITGNRTGARIAFDFIFSDEMRNRVLTDEQFIVILCRALMGRSPAQSGIAHWVNRLQATSAHAVFVEFIDSAEFDSICREYGITKGTAPPPLLPPRPPTPSGSLEGKIIILDPGHGTIGSPGAGGYNEAVAMLAFARDLKPLLEERGATVVLTRNSEFNILLSARCAQINILAMEAVRNTLVDENEIAEINRLIGIMQSIIDNPGANGNTYMNVDPFIASRTIHPDLQRIFEITNAPVIRDNFLVVSLHSNAVGAGGSSSVRGAEVYFIDPSARVNTRTYYPDFSYTAQSRAFGDILLNHINHAGIPRRSNGLRAENYAIIREINVPAVLAENGFHTNPADRELLMNPSFMERLALAYRNAIIEYFT